MVKQAYFRNTIEFIRADLIKCYNIKPTGLKERVTPKMTDQIPSTAPKRRYNEFMAQDLLHKLRSKKDFYVYLDRHRKYIPLKF